MTPAPRDVIGRRYLYDPGVDDPWDGTYNDPVVRGNPYRPDDPIIYGYRDGAGKYWEEHYHPDGTFDRYVADGDPREQDLTRDGSPNVYHFREPEEGEEPLGRSSIPLDTSDPPSTPLLPPAEPSPGADLDPTSPLGHWDPVGLRWVNDGPPSAAGVVGRAAGLDVTRPIDDLSPTVEGSAADAGLDVAGPVNDAPTTVEGSAATRVGVDPTSGPDGNADGIPGEYGDGPDLDGNGVPDEIGINPDNSQPGYPQSDPAAPQTVGGAHFVETTPENPPFVDLQDAPTSTDPSGPLPGHWDPAALRWVPDVPTTVEGTAAADLDVAAPIYDAPPTTVEGSAAAIQDVPADPIQPGPPTAGGNLDVTDARIWVDDWNPQTDPVVVEEEEEPPSVSVFDQDPDGYLAGDSTLYEQATDEGFDPDLDGTF